MEEKISTVILTDDDKTNDILSFYLNEIGAFSILNNHDNYSEVYDTLASSDKSLLIVDLTTNLKEKLNFVEKVSHDLGYCRILALAENPMVDIIVKAMRLGVNELINLPILQNELILAIEKIKTSYSKIIDNTPNCKIISIYSNKGGIGKTSIACNLAFELEKITKEKVALVDFNMSCGDVATFTNIASTFELSYVFNNLEKQDNQTYFDLGVPYQNTNLYIYAERFDTDNVLNISPLKLKNILYNLRKHFSYVVLDIGTMLDNNNITILSESDLILLVAIANLPQLRNTQKILNRFEQLGISKVKVLLNRFMENDDIDVNKIEYLLNQKIFWKLPNNYFTIIASINKGIPVSMYNENSNIAISYEGLAIEVVDKFMKDSIIGGYFGT